MGDVIASIDWLVRRFQATAEKPAIVWQGDRQVTYGWLLGEITRWQRVLDEANVPPATVVSIEGDHSPEAIALMLSLVARRCIVVPLTPSTETHKEEFLAIAEVGTRIRLDTAGAPSISNQPSPIRNGLLRGLIDAGEAGLILFSSGSTGKSKATLHHFGRLLEKFKKPRDSYVAIVLLMFDHIGGINTLLRMLASGSTLVLAESRDPDAICSVIERHRVTLLPTNPSFLNLLVLSGVHERYDLSSLRCITYGTEPMNAATLHRVNAMLPGVEVRQMYGLSEMGILGTHSRGSDSLWVKVKGEGVETKVVDGTLRIRSTSAMLGYLNETSPFDDDGWFDTADLVEVDGEYVRFLGRKSEIINVGGQKVYPAEVENVIVDLPNVADVLVVGEPNAVLGQIVAAHIVLIEPEDSIAFRNRLRAFARTRLSPFKVPMRVCITKELARTSGGKKARSNAV